MIQPEHPGSRVCRIAVIDDSDQDRARIANALVRVQETYTMPSVDGIQVENYPDANTVIQSIEESPSNPLWDIILSDVLIPDPSGQRSDVENGGFRIAECVARTYPDPDTVPFKVALITSKPGHVASHKLLAKFMSGKNSRWFFYFLKDRGTVPLELAATEQLLDMRTWEIALTHLIEYRNTENWGTFALRTMEKPEHAQSVFLSPGSIAAIETTRLMGSNRSVRTVLLVGETGTGKEVFARLLHAFRFDATTRAKKFFRATTLTGEGDLDATRIFGSIMGAVTGDRDIQGVLEEANGGTVFLDEIQVLVKSGQDTLKRFLQEFKYHRTGETYDQRDFSGLVVFGTSVTDLDAQFDTALLGRLKKNVIVIPPLRDRREEIVPAARVYLKQLGIGRAGVIPQLEPEAEEWLAKSDWVWKHNFSTLQAVLNKASVGGMKRRVTTDDLLALERDRVIMADLVYRVPPFSRSSIMVPNEAIKTVMKIPTERTAGPSIARFKYTGDFVDDYSAYIDKIQEWQSFEEFISKVAENAFLPVTEAVYNYGVNINSLPKHKDKVIHDVNLSTQLKNQFDRMVSYLIGRRIILRMATLTMKREELAMSLGFLAREDGSKALGGRNFGSYLIRCGLKMEDCNEPFESERVRQVRGDLDWVRRFRKQIE